MHVNLNYLESISGGDKSFIKEILRMFIDHTLPELENLKTRIRDKDWSGAASTAHKMKSAISMLGNPMSAELVLFIEMSAKKSENLEMMEESVEKLDEVMQALASEIEQIVKVL